MNDYVAKVHSVQDETDVQQPWVVTHTSNVVCGTVFFVNGSDVGLPTLDVVGITNAHCIENASSQRCRVMKETVVLGMCRVRWLSPSSEFDFAILVPEFVYNGAVAPISTAVLSVGHHVVIKGYPYDSEHCQHSFGSVSGHSDGHWIECNLASNVGNSGGPLLSAETNQVHGIVTQSPEGSESITQAVPMWAVVKSLRRWAMPDDRLVRLPYIDADLTKLSPSMMDQLGIDCNAEGGYVQRSTSAPVRAGDVISQVGPYPVCKHTCTVQTPEAGALPMNSEALLLLLPKKFAVRMHRSGVHGEFAVPMTQQPEKALHIREIYPFWENVPFAKVCGAVLVNLSINLLREVGSDDKDEITHRAWNTWHDAVAATPGVVVSFVAPHTYAADMGLRPLMRLMRVNDTEVRNIAEVNQYVQSKKRLRNATVLMQFEDFRMAVPLSAVQF